MASENLNSKLSSRILITLKKELQKCQDSLHIEEKKQGTSMFLIRQEQKKLTNNMAKVDIAFSDLLYSKGNPGSVESFRNAAN